VKFGEHILSEGWNNWRDPANGKNRSLCPNIKVLELAKY